MLTPRKPFCLIVVLLGLFFSLGINVADAQSAVEFSAPILDVAWSPDGDAYAAIDDHGKVVIVDAGKQTLRFQFSVPVQTLFAAVAWNSNGTELAAGIGNHVYVWNTLTWELVVTFLAGDPSERTYDEGFGNVSDAVISLFWARDDNRLVSASLSRITVFSLGAGRAIFEHIHTNLSPVVWAANDELITNGVALWNPVSGSVSTAYSFTYADGHSHSSSTLNKDRSVLASSTYNGSIEVVDANDLRPIALIHAAPGLIPLPEGGGRARTISDVAWDSSGSFLTAVTHDGDILVVNVATQAVTVVKTIAGKLSAVDWNARSNEVLYGGVSDTGQAILSIVDVSSIAGVPDLTTPLPSS